MDHHYLHYKKQYLYGSGFGALAKGVIKGAKSLAPNAKKFAKKISPKVKEHSQKAKDTAKKHSQKIKDTTDKALKKLNIMKNKIKSNINIDKIMATIDNINQNFDKSSFIKKLNKKVDLTQEHIDYIKKEFVISSKQIKTDNIIDILNKSLSLETILSPDIQKNISNDLKHRKDKLENNKVDSYEKVDDIYKDTNLQNFLRDITVLYIASEIIINISEQFFNKLRFFVL